MRLLKLVDGFELFHLVDFDADEVPDYAILSHTWGPKRDEISLQDIQHNVAHIKSSYSKLQFCAQCLRKHSLQYIWVDSCCIDQSNSVELMTAINSMFRYYQNASICFVYLADVSGFDASRNPVEESVWHAGFGNSRWFKRGWTLQELLAPETVEFYTQDGRFLGTKHDLGTQIQGITSIPVLAIRGSTLTKFSVPERLSWAVGRETKLEEDRAYSLLGIFEVSLSVIYGEGRINAMRRLRAEIETRERQRAEDLYRRSVKDGTSIGAAFERLEPIAEPRTSPSKVQDLLDQVIGSISTLVPPLKAICNGIIIPEWIGVHNERCSSLYTQLRSSGCQRPRSMDFNPPFRTARTSCGGLWTFHYQLFRVELNLLPLLSESDVIDFHLTSGEN
ncbi:HET-domain-containing protein [Pyrenochaeta sp. DS3sAY3a]|nr:HET-domain-containing protein [Pyrenochaeta sp. DS3sAY3a]